MFEPAYRQVRYLRRGPLGGVLITLGVVLVFGALVAVDLNGQLRMVVATVGSLMTLIAAVARVEVVVSDRELVVRTVPVRSRRIPLDRIERMEVVIADNLVPIFGGWNSRQGLVNAMVRNVEGDRSVGNRAVRFHLTGGRFIQVGSWQPSRLQAEVQRRQAR